MEKKKEQYTGLEGLFNFQVHEAEELWQRYIYLYLPNIENE